MSFQVFAQLFLSGSAARPFVCTQQSVDNPTYSLTVVWHVLKWSSSWCSLYRQKHLGHVEIFSAAFPKKYFEPGATISLFYAIIEFICHRCRFVCTLFCPSVLFCTFGWHVMCNSRKSLLCDESFDHKMMSHHTVVFIINKTVVKRLSDYCMTHLYLD